MLQVAVDLVDVQGLAEALERSPQLSSYIFNDEEHGYSIQRLSSSLSFKECLLKVGIVSSFLDFKKVSLRHRSNGAPYAFSPHSRIAEELSRVAFSISHTRTLTICFLERLT